MKVRDLMELLETLCPLSYACDWDHSGLQVGRRDAEVRRVMIALDLTDAVIDAAQNGGCDFILTHHPLLFSPLRQVTDGSVLERYILRLVESGIACAAMHTNFDAAPGCMADLAAARLGLMETVPVEPVGDGGIGKVGNLPEPVSLKEFCIQVKKAFSLPFLMLYDQGDENRKISRVGILPGSGKGEIGLARDLGAQAYVTGDMGHHPALDAMAEGLAVLDAGHYGLEWIFIEFMEQFLREHLPEEIEIRTMPFRLPGRVL
ncbi:Nif3-like dinuclear metal center hexameric protein [Hominifimenecus sp. rT4P-3]|uniref:Nif3-like dinuclear metal center hexameric protein n=1 Tax=Hominifimenecus sp. rT4P-3 TaxID=3242979 RepID=UPI003DA227A0